MKLQSKKSKRLTIIGIVVAAIVLVALIIGAILLFGINAKDEEYQPTDIVNIVVSSYPKTTYYVGESFDSTGTKIQVLTYDMAYTSFVGYGSLTFSGFDSSAPNDAQVITVAYQGFTTTFTVQILPAPTTPPALDKIEVQNFRTTYPMDEWNKYGPDVLGASVKFIYADGTEGETKSLQPSWIYGATKVSGPCTLDITIKYNHDGVLCEQVITITITE